MRAWGVILAVGSLIGLFNSTHAADQEFSPHRLIETRFYDGHYEVKFHRTRDGRNVLMALDSKRLNLIKFDINEARVLSEDRLVDGGKAPNALASLSSSSGEFWVAFSRELRDGSRDIQLHSDSREEYFSIEETKLPQNLELKEIGDELVLIATYQKSITVFRRLDGRLEQIAEVETPTPIVKAQTLVGKNENLIVVTLTTDQKLYAYDLDRDYDDLVPRFARSIKANLMEATLGPNGEVLAALVVHGKKSDVLQIFNEGTNRLSAPQTVKTNIGQIQWIKNPAGQLQLAGYSSEKNNTSIRFFNLKGVERIVAAGDAKLITGLSPVKVAQTHYLVYVKDQKDVYIQGDDATSVIRAPVKSKEIRLSSTGKLNGGHEVIAVMTDFDRSTRVQVIGFSRWREAKR